jgi:hypothetical protein
MYLYEPLQPRSIAEQQYHDMTIWDERYYTFSVTCIAIYTVVLNIILLIHLNTQSKYDAMSDNSRLEACNACSFQLIFVLFQQSYFETQKKFSSALKATYLLQFVTFILFCFYYALYHDQSYVLELCILWSLQGYFALISFVINKCFQETIKTYLNY